MLRGGYLRFKLCYFGFRGNSVNLRLSLYPAALRVHFGARAGKFCFYFGFYKLRAVVVLLNGERICSNLRFKTLYLGFRLCFFNLRLSLFPVAFRLHFRFGARNFGVDAVAHFVGRLSAAGYGLHRLRFKLCYFRLVLDAVNFLLCLRPGAFRFHFGARAGKFRFYFGFNVVCAV